MMLLEVCNIVVLVPGWEASSGARREIARAEKIHMPVFDVLDFGLPSQIISQCNDRIRNMDLNLIRSVTES